MHNHHSTNLPVQWKIINILICFTLVGCTAINFSSTPTPSPVSDPTSVPIIPSSDALVTFHVSMPEPLPPGDSLYLVILDEVTGLGLNPQQYIMEAEDDTHFFVIIPFVLGSMVQYRYHRQGSTFSQEHLPDGRPVRYRLYHVEGPGIVQDTISRWTDSRYINTSGELRGRVVDAIDGKPLVSIMVVAGGYQTYTSADGTFLMKVLPPGNHNIVAYATDGSYHPFQQGAIIKTDSSTYAEIAVAPSEMITATFIVSIPDQTPTDIPVRLAGNLYQLGNTFTDMAGGINGITSRMPILSKREDGRYSLAIRLPIGVDVRYKYSIGDGFWNSERTSNGKFGLRQIIVPDHDIEIQDRVDAWGFGPQGSISFDTHVLPGVSADEQIFIQFDPGFGWTVPLPMWGRVKDDGSILWSYELSSPLDIVSTVRYRFCLEQECDVTGIISSTNSTVQDFSIPVTNEPKTIEHEIAAWEGLALINTPAVIPNVPVNARVDGFVAGIAFQEDFHPTWEIVIPHAISDIRNLHANWVFLQPTWAYTNYAPPVLEYSPQSNPGWNNLINWGRQAHLLGLKVALIPLPEFSQQLDASKITPISDAEDWRMWFDNYARMIMHFTALANEINLEAIVIGDNWVLPPALAAITQPYTFDTAPAWRELIGNIRSIYTGKVIWATSYPNDIQFPPQFLDQVDEIYVLWSQPLAALPEYTSRQMKDEALKLIDRDLAPLSHLTNKPIILAISYHSDSLTEQMNAYNAMMMAVNERAWLHGIVSTGYYPALPMQDTSPSVYGKPASGVLWYWFPLFLGQ